MSPGIIELISFLLGLSGLGLQPNPKAPTVDQVIEYAMPDADVVVHFDAGSVIPGNYKVLSHLGDDPRIKSSPEVAKTVGQVIAQVEGGRAMVKMMTGLDLTTDINDATAFVKYASGGDPTFVAEVHGNFSPALLDKIGKLQGGAPIKVGTGTELDLGGQAIAITKSGVLLAGTVPLVHDRLDASWKAPAHASGTTLGALADVIGGKPVFAMVFALSPDARTAALAAIGQGNFASDLVARHKLGSLAIYHDGIGWTWIDSTMAGLDSMATISEGVLELFRAGQIAPRGIAKIVLGALESYRRADPRVATILDHKDDLMKLVTTFTGDGSFKTKIDRDPKTFALHVRATGKSFSEVVPLAAIVPFAGVGMLALRGKSDAMPAPAMSAPAMPASTSPAIHHKP